MCSTWVKGITLFLLISAVLGQTGEEGCTTCGRLGSGSNPCSCNNVIVEATEVTKPILYAAPEAINEAAIVREDGKSACSETQTNTLSISESNINDDTISPSDNNFNSPIATDLSRKYQSSELTDIAQTEPTYPNSNVQIVPNFSPVNNPCNPSKLAAIISGTRVKVTPAYPVKMKCCQANPYQACVNYISGIRGDPLSAKTHIGTPIGSPQFGIGSYDSSSIIYDTSNGLSRLESGNGDYVISSMNHDASIPFGGTFGTPIGLPQSEFGSYGTSNIAYDTPNPFGTPNIVSGIRTPFEDIRYGIPFQRRPKDQLPADPISLTLAYRNLVAPKIYYNKGKKLVSEGSLSFGHRTLPIELKKEKKLIDVPEEKLVTVDRPIMELKLSPASSIMIGDNDDEDDDTFAELEAMEREHLERREQLDRVASNFLTYGDVGYRPIDANVVKPNIAINAPSLNLQGVDQRIVSNGEENGIGGKLIGQNVGHRSIGGCGPSGPSLPGYVPGSVIVQQQIEMEEPRENEQIDMDSYNYNVDNVETNEEVERNSGLGIIDRLRNAAARRNKISSLCFH